MDKVGSPRGLVRFSTEYAMKNRWSPAQMLRHALRPRVLIYSTVLLLIVSVFFGTLFNRKPLKLDVIRDRGAMGREVENDMIENVYRLQIMNTAETPHRYRIEVSGIDGIALETAPVVALDATQSLAVPVRVRLPQGQGNKGSNKIWFSLKAVDQDGLEVKEKAVFFVPR
jgi:polyferredoxin